MTKYYKPQIMTARKVDSLTLTRRAEEERIRDLLKYQNESQRLINAIKNESQLSMHCSSNEKSIVESDDKRRRREQEALRRETVAKREEENRVEEAKTKEALQKERIEREIQRICDSSEELKELERNIKIAYVNKERAAQHQESLLTKRIDNAREELIEQHMEEQRKDIIQKENAKENARRETLVAQKIRLQEQMHENDVSADLYMAVIEDFTVLLKLFVSCCTLYIYSYIHYSFATRKPEKKL
jgi:hypothetical protein